VIDAILYSTKRFFRNVQDLAVFSVKMVAAVFRRPHYWRDIYEQTYFAGVGSLPVVLVSSFFAGQALALQFARQLRETGSESVLGTMMAIAVVRALGPDLTGMVVAARLASGYTAEIGSMKSTDQIDALTAFGTDPVSKLAAPRLIGIVIMLPILTFIANTVQFLGGALMATVHAKDKGLGNKKSRTRRLDSFPIGVQRRAHHRRTRTRTTSLHRGPGGEE